MKKIRANNIELNITYTIKEIEPSPWSQKIVEMGCIPGTKIIKIFKAPLGDPYAFLIDSYVLSMRDEEAKTIIVN